jgi:hypothetical protein
MKDQPRARGGIDISGGDDRVVGSDFPSDHARCWELVSVLVMLAVAKEIEAPVSVLPGF